ncbi:serine/threonine-protein kinase 19-like [Dermacentor silvarum]|uniref:serine/threonine-protein kinase 19-like n=1 Tax=Dermacentor silvarum TaxID=543639 RepID=UPI002100AE84|nr:serine/threonine-protein kinase 19-like [Dermacentor silvarum]
MRARKRLCCPAEPFEIANGQDAAVLPSLHFDLPSQRVAGETKSALQMLRSSFPSDKFLAGFPAIAMRHQLYAMVQNRVDVDNALLGPHETDAAVLFTEDYLIYVRQRSGHNPAVEKFLEKVVMRSQNISCSHTSLAMEYSLCDNEISELEHLGLLVPRGIGSDGYHWWLGVPGAVCFLRTLARGRVALLQMLRRSKHQELSRAELESQRLPRGTKLAIGHFIYDAIGANLVTCVKTTSGDVLRLRE